MDGGGGKLATDDGAVDAGVPPTLRGCELGVWGPFVCSGIGEDMLVEGEIDRFAGFRAIADGESELTDLVLSWPPMAFRYDW